MGHRAEHDPFSGAPGTAPSRPGEPSGYAHPDYPVSLVAHGTPRHLPNCGGWLLERPIPGSDRRDAMGCYPLFCCADWPALGRDLDALAGDLVAVSLVSDPFAPVDVEFLQSGFDRVGVFKEHFVADLALPIDTIVKRSHRDTVRRAVRRVEVRVCERPKDRLDRWTALFAHLVRRHGITGMRAFSREAFAEQLGIPGMVMFEALADGRTVGMDLWYQQRDVAYGHLVAFDDEGYALRASYATKWYLMHYFRDRVRWLDFGGGAGLSDASDGLTVFKAGWSTGRLPVYLCCRVLQPDVYRSLADAAGVGETAYFPAYRAGEFA